MGREWVRAEQKAREEKRESQEGCHGQERAVKGKEGTVIATNRGLGKRKRRKGSRAEVH